MLAAGEEPFCIKGVKRPPCIQLLKSASQWMYISTCIEYLAAASLMRLCTVQQYYRLYYQDYYYLKILVQQLNPILHLTFACSMIMRLRRKKRSIQIKPPRPPKARS